MKYYIDFEATEEEKQIISVGCISEKGEEFYSLVKAEDIVTERIEELTGISQNDVDNAPDYDEVFSDLYDWCNEDDIIPEFICYGDGDFDFIYNSIPLTCSFKANSMLSFLYQNMNDCSTMIKEKFFVNKTISLEKLGKLTDPDMIEQNHNALDDARLLKHVYEKITSETNDRIVFTEYFDPSRQGSRGINKVVRLNGQQVIQEFASLNEAVECLKKEKNDKGPTYLKDAAEKIRKAAREGSKYFNSNWRLL